MKILAIADLHGKTIVLDKVLEGVSKAEYDAIVFVGDVTNFGGEKEANAICDILVKTGKKTFVLGGNCDGPEVFSALEARGLSLHKRVDIYKDCAFMGYGKSNPTPFNTPSEEPDDVIRKEIEQLYMENKEKMLRKTLVLATHAAPKDTKCDLLPIGHVGSEGIRECIEMIQPAVNICGHIHEGRGVDRIGNTLIVNPGELGKRHYAIINTKTGEAELR